MAERVSVLIDEEAVDKRIAEIGKQISEDYAGKTLKLVCILKGSVPFMAELAKRITVPVTIDFMSVSSYGNGTATTGNVVIKKDLDEPIAEENVIIIEDIVDSGNTLHHLAELLKDRGANSVKICALLDKPDRRIVQVNIDYKGFVIPDEFVVGYGLDYAQKYRNLPFVGVLHFDED